MNNAFEVVLITPKAAVARSALRTLYKLHINSRLTPTDRSKNTELRIVISLNNTVSTVCIMRQEMIIIVTRLILRLISGMEEMAVILLFIVNFLSVLEITSCNSLLSIFPSPRPARENGEGRVCVLSSF